MLPILFLQRQFATYLLIPIFVSLPSGLSGQDEVDFNRDIRPILSDRCFKCHGPDENSRATDLRLDQREFAKEALEADSLEEVELLRRIFTDDEEERMPPADSKLTLSSREKQLLKNWVQSGAKFDSHWAFVLPNKAPLPKVKMPQWPKNEIDYFTLAKMERQGIAPNSPASRERLIRRVTFDLTGLPPTEQEIQQFLSDESPNAFEKVVDRLLKSNSYGERMTSEWLDVARYSDSFGYQVDRGRHVWPWRDWVINAFNNNKPYDQFVVEQLAGDMLENATDSQILATAFNRLHPQKVEGGSVPEEFRVEYVADRTHTFGTAFLGLTLECARCHDHKYDPLSQAEYYKLFAFFNNVDEAGLYSYFTNSTPTPTLLLSNDQTKTKLVDLQKKIDEKEKEIGSYQPPEASFATWLKGTTETLLSQPVESNSFEDFKGGGNRSVAGISGKGVQLTGDDAIGLKTGNFSRNQPFSVSIWIKSPQKLERAVVLHRSRAWTDAGSRGYQLLIEEGKLSASLIHFWPGNAIRVRTREVLPVDKWLQVGFSYDGSSKAGGLQIYVNGQLAETEIVRDNLYKNITGGGGNNIAIGQRFRDNGFKNGQIDEVRVFDRQLTSLEFEFLHKHPTGEKVDLNSLGAIDDETRNCLKELFVRHHDPAMTKLQKELKALRDERSKLVDPVIEIMVMKEMKNRRKTYRLQRGIYDAPAEAVTPGIPVMLTGSAKPTSRLELARWIVGEENPLTSRVTVNRYWQMIFGDGLVRTPEDFGSQGTPPTHARLLDWLSKDFMDNGWDLKRLLKKMVMSATYQQDSTLDPEKFKRDPGNELLARASSFRLPAEMLRDNALFTSGLLVSKIGGPGAKPYDLALSFKPVGVDKGEGVYRRSVYTYWKRTGPSPVMMTLDASKRDVCTVKREKTATPLQAFVLLNDPQFVEASRALAARTLAQETQPDRAINLVFRRLTSREPNEKEARILLELMKNQTRFFSENKADTTKFLSVGQYRADPKLDPATVAALTSVTQTIMNFDESVMRR